MSHLPENPEQTEAPAGFLQRWSRRKIELEDELAERQESVDAAPDDSAASPLQADAESAEVGRNDDGEPPPLTDEDMVPLDTLDADSDYTPFMSAGVSSELRQLALKKLFFSGLFRARDGLDDYDDDFTSFEPLGDTITSDMKFHQRREEKARLAREQEEREALQQRQRLAERDESGCVEQPADEADANGDVEVSAGESEVDHSQPTDVAEAAPQGADHASSETPTPITTENTGRRT